MSTVLGPPPDWAIDDFVEDGRPPNFDPAELSMVPPASPTGTAEFDDVVRALNVVLNGKGVTLRTVVLVRKYNKYYALKSVGTETEQVRRGPGVFRRDTHLTLKTSLDALDAAAVEALDNAIVIEIE